eukprot:09976.XXX_141707_143827_1 [CDS] Oithona nana genome sequencing.
MLNYKSLLQNTELKQSWPGLKEELESKANKVMGIFGLAATGEKKVIMRPRLTGLKSVGSLRDLRSHDVGKLLSFQCSVIRQGHISQLCTWLAFQCEKCDATCVVEQKPKGRYVRPNKCPSEGCRSQTFTPQRSHPATKTINSQMLRVQESEGRLQGGNGGRLPRAMDLHFSNDLCDTVSVGDVISLTAIVKVSSDPSDHMFNLYLEGLSVANSSSSQADNDKTQIEFTLLDYSMIQEVFSLGPEIFKLIVASLCPSIFGHELVKAGLVLALFGGTSKYANDRTHVPIRGDPHVLVVGDPGLGKSQILLSVQNCAPKSVFVTATGATTTGLTVTIVKGPGNEFVMEAGALVLADQGCCCIDEFDKMSNQHPALLEAMEQQSISLAKSGVTCSVPAHTAILAAANPVGGHYNKAKTVSENLKMHPALLSRFDLVFILIDKPDEEIDSRLSNHIMNLHSRSESNHDSANLKMTGYSSSSSANSTLTTNKTGGSWLTNKLSIQGGEEIDLLPPEQLRKYIAYARRYVKPELSSPAAMEIQKFYLELRENHHQSDATPITTRQLESLIRLTQARAKLELRQEATAQDALEVIEIMRHSMIDTFCDETDSLDFSRALHGSGMSKGSVKKKLVSALQKVAKSLCKNTFHVDEIKQVAMSVGLAIDKFSDTLFELNNHGFLLKKSSQVYQLLSAE